MKIHRHGGQNFACRLKQGCTDISRTFAPWNFAGGTRIALLFYALIGCVKLVRTELPDEMTFDDQLLDERWTTAAPIFDPAILARERLFHEESLQICDDVGNGGHSSGVPPKADELVWTESSDRVLPTLQDKARYNVHLAPNQRLRKVTQVNVAVYIESMSSFKAQTMDFEVDMYLAMSWYDWRLAHNCSHPILIIEKRVADLVWQPDLYFVNSKFAYLQDVTRPNFMILIYPDGMVFKSMRVDVTLSCMMDLGRFPMDDQSCPLIIQSYAYVQPVVNLNWHVDEASGFPISNNPNIKLNDMEITDRKWLDCSGQYPMFRGTGNWSCLHGVIKMHRLVMFHVIQTYLPTGMLVVISWLSFWLDPRAAPARICLTITTLLTITTMSNGARIDLPQVSYIKALDIWLSVCTAFVFCVLLEYTMVSYYVTLRSVDCTRHEMTTRLMQEITNNVGQPLLISKSQAANKQTGPSTRFKKEDRNKSCGVCLSRWERISRRIDKFSRVAFPFLFLLFSVIYWIYYKVVA